MNVILDENLPPRWSEFLEPHGIRAIPWRNLGTVGDSDDVIFDTALDGKAVIITQDLDFTRLLALRGTRLPSIIQLRVHSPTPEIIGDTLLKILEDRKSQLLEGCLISVDLERHRLRLLPLG